MDESSDQTQSTRSTQSLANSGALTGLVIAAAIRVHKRTGPGLLESVYEACLSHELHAAGLRVRNQVPVPIRYGDVELEVGYRLDLLVEDHLVVELKCIERFERVHLAQMMTYLRLARLRLGLLINFNVARLADGVRRVATDTPPQPDPDPKNSACSACSAFDPKTWRLEPPIRR
jgi:GxxExxY protein